jgi:hypothetical protein
MLHSSLRNKVDQSRFGPGKVAIMKPQNEKKQRYFHRRIGGNVGNNVEFEFKYRSRSESIPILFEDLVGVLRL